MQFCLPCRRLCVSFVFGWQLIYYIATERIGHWRSTVLEYICSVCVYQWSVVDLELLEGGKEAHSTKNWDANGHGGQGFLGRDSEPENKVFSANSATMMVFLNTSNGMFLLCQNNFSILIVCVLTIVTSYDCLCGVKGGGRGPPLPQDPPLSMI